MPLVRSVKPYVAYVNESMRVTLYGEHLLEADGKSLFIGNAEALDIQASSDTHATVDLPPLPAGEYTVRIGDAPHAGLEMARVVVRQAPVYRDASIDLNGRVRASEYDAERDAIYLVTESSDGRSFGLRLRNDGTGGWRTDTLPISAPEFQPHTVALSADGDEVLIASDGCVLHRIHADTFVVRETVQKACSGRSSFTDIAPLVDGRVLLHQHNPFQPADVLEFPGFAPTEAFRGNEAGGIFILNGNRDRLLYVKPYTPGVAGAQTPGHADLYDVSGAFKRVPFEAGPDESSEEFARHNLSMSADGSRTLHWTNVYDREFNLIGRLTADFNWGLVGTALNASGTRAVVVKDHSPQDHGRIYIYDLSGSGPDFPQLGAHMSLPIRPTGPRPFVPPSGGAVFVTTDVMRLTSDPPEDPPPRLYVRANPALKR
jgi:hypothetical protein